MFRIIVQGIALAVAGAVLLESSLAPLLGVTTMTGLQIAVLLVAVVLFTVSLMGPGGKD